VRAGRKRQSTDHGRALERLCIRCLSAETGVTRSRIEATITTVAAVLAIRQSMAGCERCPATTDVFALI